MLIIHLFLREFLGLGIRLLFWSTLARRRTPPPASAAAFHGAVNLSFGLNTGISTDLSRDLSKAIDFLNLRFRSKLRF